MSDKHIVLNLMEPYPGILKWGTYGLIVGCFLAASLFVIEHWIIVFLSGVAIVLNFHMCRFYNDWSRAYNTFILQQVQFEVLLESKEDGTLDETLGLTEDKDETNEH